MDIVTEEAIAGLPTAIQRSLRRAGVIGRKIPREVVITQQGRIRSSEASRWLRFRSRETYAIEPPSFVWDARFKIAGIPVGRGVDSFDGGHGRMRVKILGLLTVLDVVGAELDQGSLLRWLNETMWFPAVWASGIITWEAISDTKAMGSVQAGDLSVGGEFCFDAEGRLINFHADRFRDVGDGFELRAWSTPLHEHARFDGIELPVAGVGVWHLPDGDLEYVEIRTKTVTYLG